VPTKLYLTSLAADYTPATLRGAWDRTAGSVTNLIGTKDRTDTVTSIIDTATAADTTYDELLYRGVSNRLDAQTISGTLNLVVGVDTSTASADAYWHVHVYVTQGDSDTPRGTLLTDYVENTTNEWPSTDTGSALQSSQSLSSLAVSAGDRIVVELGCIRRNAINAAVEIYYGTGSGSATVSDLTVGANPAALAGYVEFSADLVFTTSIRVTQDALEIVLDQDPVLRATQAALEVVLDQDPALRVTQAGLEVLLATGTSVAVTQAGLEVLVEDTTFPLPGPDLRLTQAGLEVIVDWGYGEVRVSQVRVELFSKFTTLSDVRVTQSVPEALTKYTGIIEVRTSQTVPELLDQDPGTLIILSQTAVEIIKTFTCERPPPPPPEPEPVVVCPPLEDPATEGAGCVSSTSDPAPAEGGCVTLVPDPEFR
jgi:hypothetical protein